MRKSKVKKLKTRKSVAKRFKMTKKGKFKHWHPYKSHLLTSKTRKRKRRLRKSSLVPASEIKMIRRAMPYA